MKAHIPDSRSPWPPLLERAVRLAARAHHGHFRKREGGPEGCASRGNDLPEDCIPYITHLVGTAFILARLGARDEVVAAGLLHDYLEDVAGPEGRRVLREELGPEVLRLVEAVTEDKLRERSPEDSWDDRKQAQLERLEEEDADVVLLKGADSLHNALSLLADLDAAPDPAAVWDRFNAPPRQQLWYLASVAESVRRRLGGHPLVRELEAAVEALRKWVPEGPEGVRGTPPTS